MDILRTAIDSGIKYFDTAGAYGNAEEILGKFNIGKYDVKVISKLRAVENDDEQFVADELKKTLERLNLKFIYGYMLHRTEDFYKVSVMKALSRMKERGLVKNIGVSVYEPEDALFAVKNELVSIVQIPYNVLDQRLDDTDFFETAKRNKVKVFARSAFLQGLLLMNSKSLPKNLKIAERHIEKFNTIARTFNYSARQTALLYSYCHPGIDYVVFGVDTVKQLKENVRIINRAKEFTRCYENLRGAFRGVEREIIIPSLWKV